MRVQDLTKARLHLLVPCIPIYEAHADELAEARPTIGLFHRRDSFKVPCTIRLTRRRSYVVNLTLARVLANGRHYKGQGMSLDDAGESYNLIPE